MQDTKRQMQVIEKIIHATDEEIHDIRFLLDRIYEFGIVPMAWLQETDSRPIYTDDGMIQVPGEFAGFCHFLLDQDIRTAMEVGVYRGRSSYFMCAVLYRNCPELVYDMVDIADCLDEFEEFSKVLPCLRKCIPNTSADFIGRQYDFVFIDADHSYDGAMQDYLNVGQYAKKLVCFHDIYAHEYDSLKGGTVRTWKEISVMTPHLPKMVFSQFPDRWMGIGIVLNLSEQEATMTEPDYYAAVIERKNEFLQTINPYKELYVYGARNDSRRMYQALKQIAYPVRGMVICEEGENREGVKDIPIFYTKDITKDETTGIIVCYRPSLRQPVLESLKKYESQLIVCDDVIASFLTE